MYIAQYIKLLQKHSFDIKRKTMNVLSMSLINYFVKVYIYKNINYKKKMLKHEYWAIYLSNQKFSSRKHKED